MINNQYFHSHIGCDVTKANNFFLKVRQYRNNIFHSSSMELEESEANSYIDDMIAVLQDGKELLQQPDAQIAVNKLQDLKKKDFIITTESFDEILREIKEELAKILKSTESAATKEEYDDLKKKLIDLEAKMSGEKEGKLEIEKELEGLKKTIKELEFQMSQETLEKAELKKKFTVLEILVSEQKEEMAKITSKPS
ncbi:CAP-Gly domain-containing linker protein 1-like isoform X2 [Ruditapes philippinarum]|uniref:CAP-Gly domain-containing linker protein 1-like isoform X2 n=1 Tax=Ruditapes philippinarum TaxID=129788 RepID=UPI00295BB4F0|nr:CAP-Gly domain-containing linker protein 1-like isoform X2 [Ruditapes philippinarum]